MKQPAAKQGDSISSTDTHLIVTPSGAVVPVLMPFMGSISSGCSGNVRFMGRAAATVGSVANNTPPHLPTGGSFQKPPSNQGRILSGSSSVRVNGQAVARNGDRALTCNDPIDAPVGQVQATGSVRIGN